VPSKGIGGQTNHRESRLGQGPSRRLSRRALASAAAVPFAALALLLATPASAQQSGLTITGSNFSVTPAPTNGVISTSQVTVNGRFQAQGFQPSIDWISVSLVWHGKPPGPSVPGPYTYCATKPPPSGPPAPPCKGNDITFPQPLSPAPAYNGPYEVNATAQASDFPNQTKTTSMPKAIDFALAVPPPPVAHVAAVVNKDRSVTVSWDRDATPDLQSYWIYRKGPGAKDYTPVAQTPQVPSGVRMSVIDGGSQSAAGAYSYELESRRNGATGDATSVVLSNRNDPKSLSNTVTVPEPPAGTPTTPATQPQPVGPATPPPVLKSTTSGVGKVSNSPAATPTSEAVTPDPGYQRGLPYASSGTQPGSEGEGDGATVALTPSGGRHKDNARGVLIPVAGGAVLFMGALHLRWLKKQLDVPASTLT
jgi:hypothetical protein